MKRVAQYTCLGAAGVLCSLVFVILSADPTPQQASTNIAHPDSELIEKAEKIVNREKTIPAGVVPIVETKGNFIIVYWPIPRDGSNFVPGPARYAEVLFDKDTHSFIEIHGAH